MHNTFFVFMLFSLTTLFVVASCKKDKSTVDYTNDADCSAIVPEDNAYTNSIKAILDASCASAGCHNAISATEGIDLSKYANAKNAFLNKEVLCSIHHGSGCKPMPSGSPKLSDATINKIDCWVKSGYLE